MCGRFVLYTESLIDCVAELPAVADVDTPQGLPGPRYNIAPTQVIPVIRFSQASEETVAEISPSRWGLLPHWKKDDSGPPLFNARAETVSSKPSFREAFKVAAGSGRCVIPMNGYYEWYTEGKKKTPHYVHLPDDQLLWAAGLYSTALEQLSATIITTEAATPLEWLHHRLPKFLAADEISQWVFGDRDEAAELLEPTVASVREALSADPVAKEVGNIRNDYAELIEQASN